MDAHGFIKQLESNLPVIIEIAKSTPVEVAGWKPVPDRWSVLEVMNHLVDEEREDFRFCTKLVLETPQSDWPDLSSWSWVESRAYNTRDLSGTIGAFETERRQSLEWLVTLRNPDWDTLHAGKSPFKKPMRAGDVLASWIAHDYFHIRQMVTLRWEYLNAFEASPYSTSYGGAIE